MSPRRTCLALLLLGVLLLARAAPAQTCPGMTVQATPLDEEPLTVSATAVGLTETKYKQASGVATMATVQVQNAPIVVRVVGVPTTSAGRFVPSGGTFTICGIDSITAFRAIRLSSTNATLWVSYYKSRAP
jgi:hypothetical protein